MSSIHPTALVSPSAYLGNDVIVGPGAIIEGGAVIGSGCHIMARAVIEGSVKMGSNNEVGYGAILGAAPQLLGATLQILDDKSAAKSDVIIGDGNIFREYVTIHRGATEGSSTIIGNNSLLMVGVHIGHNSIVKNKVIIANNCLIAGHVEIHDQANLGGGAVFHQFIRIGRLAMVRGGSRISRNIPPFLTAYESNLVAGLNAIGLRRAGLSAELRMELKKAFQLLYRSGMNITQALEAAAQQQWSAETAYFFEFVAQSHKRGVCKIAPRNLSELEESSI